MIYCDSFLVFLLLSQIYFSPVPCPVLYLTLQSQHHEDEKRALSREIIVLNNHLMEAKITINKLREENVSKLYAAIQKLICTGRKFLNDWKMPKWHFPAVPQMKSQPGHLGGGDLRICSPRTFAVSAWSVILPRWPQKRHLDLEAEVTTLQKSCFLLVTLAALSIDALSL